MSLADEVLEQLAPLTRAFPDPAGTLDAVVRALTGPAEVVATAARATETRAAWSAVRDPDDCPPSWLDWLGQHAGEFFEPGVTEDQKRQQIRDTPHIHRGQIATLIAQVEPTLVGQRSVRVIPRAGGNPWNLTVLTRTSETPDPAASEAAARFRKAAGVKLTFLVSDAPVWDEGTLAWDDAAAKPWDDIVLGDV
jgi:hypothetical protein